MRVMLALLLAGCATVQAPTDASMATADYGPAPANPEAMVRAFYAQALKDPDSALYRPLPPLKKMWIGNRLDPAGKYSYVACPTLNAKNAYGAYVGYQTEALFIRGGAIVDRFVGIDAERYCR